MPDPQAPGFDWKQLLQFLPMAVAGARGGMAGLGGFGEGYSRGAAVREEQEQVRRAQAAREAAEQYAQSRDVLGDQRYEQEQRLQKQQQMLRLLEALPSIGDRGLEAAEAAGVIMPEQQAAYAQKSVDEWIAALNAMAPDLGADPTVLRQAVGDLRPRASARLLANLAPKYRAYTEGMTEQQLAQSRANTSPIFGPYPFSEVERMLSTAGIPPARPKMGTPQFIDTVEGNQRVRKAVVPREGETYPVPPPQRDPLAQELAAARIRELEEKRRAAGDEKATKRQVVINATQQTLDVVDELLDKEGTLTDTARAAVGASRLTGMQYVPTTDALLGQATIDRLKARLVTDLLSELKSQSKTGATGFGQLNLKELRIMENSASKLNPNLSERAFAAELRRIRGQLEKILREPGGAATPSPTAVPDGAAVVFPDGSEGYWDAALGHAVKGKRR